MIHNKEIEDISNELSSSRAAVEYTRQLGNTIAETAVKMEMVTVFAKNGAIDTDKYKDYIQRQRKEIKNAMAQIFAHLGLEEVEGRYDRIDGFDEIRSHEVEGSLISAADIKQILQDLNKLKNTLGDIESNYAYSKRMAIYWNNVAVDRKEQNKELRQVLQEIKDELLLNGYSDTEGPLTKTFSIINRILNTKTEAEEEYDAEWIHDVRSGR